MKAKQQKLWEDLKLKDNLGNLLTGLIIVILGGITLYRFINNMIVNNNKAVEKISTASESLKIAKDGEFKNLNSENLQTLPTKYTVQIGETLWSISEKFYNTGYNWVNIAKENGLTNADAIFSGNELIIPKVGDINGDGIKTTEPVKADQYVIAQGDTLWSIAVKLYGDGYKWVSLAQANNLSNPNVIHVGNVLRFIK